MNAVKRLLYRLLSDEDGGEVLEYVIVAALIVMVAVAAIQTLGTKVQSKWEGINTAYSW